jgi:poly(3-hydroxybutyrate) depolymerase
MEQRDLILVESLALPFLLSIPKEGSESRQSGQWPVLLFLHGLDEGLPTKIQAGLTAHGPLSTRSSPLATSEFIVVAPQLPARGDLWRAYGDVVCEIATWVQSNHRGDRDRTYLTGFSFGGNGVFDVALPGPSIWAALWAVDPTRVPESDPGLPVWLSSGEASRRNNHRFIERLRLEPFGAGADDRVFLDEGLDHVGTASSAYRSDTVYQWLLSKHA